jgi:uncharacterized protein YecE (DUF72 family)
MDRTLDWHLGTMGFSWKDWVGSFYPQGTAPRDYLGYYSQIFNAVEIDSTFYGTPRLEVINRWDVVTPTNFKICLKMPKVITHEKALIDAHPDLDDFINRSRVLGDKLGVILLQFPPGFVISKFNDLDTFLSDLPVDLRFAVELRHTSWNTVRVEDMLSAHQIAWASTEYETLPKRVVRTADFLYIRLIGYHGRFRNHKMEQIDVTPQLKWWWSAMQPQLPSVTSVYLFINNDYSGFAAGTLARFKNLFGFETGPEELPGQLKLF